MPLTITGPRPWRAAVSLLSVLLVAGLLTPVRTATAQDAGSATIRPETAGNTAVRSGQAILVDGSAPQGPVTEASLVAVQRDGQEIRQPYGATVLERPASTDRQYLRSDDGRLSGRLVLDCVFQDPVESCYAQHGEVVAVRLELIAGGQQIVTNAVPVDYARPVIRQYRVVAPRVVEVRFSEPVRGDDSPLDWQVTDPSSLVTGVRTATGDCGHLPAADGRADRSGCTRLLDLLTAVPEDGQPQVTYEPALNRPLYSDDAGNEATRDSRTPNSSRAVDAVRPAVPTIDSVAGRTPSGQVAGREPAPVVRASGLTQGHRVWVERIPQGGQPVRGPEVVAEGSTAELTSPGLPADGAHVLRVVAQDPHDNASTDPGTPARADGSRNPVTYVLDRVVPVLVSAAVDGGKVRVALTEDVTGPNAPGDWRVQDPARTVTAVEGTGSSRLLTVSGGAPAGGRVEYAPTGARYADAAGNEVANGTLVIGGVPLPLVVSPAGPVITRATTLPVSGTARPGATVALFRDGAPDTVLATTVVGSGGGWSVTAPLARDQRNDLRVRATQGAEPSSPIAAVPAITQDSTPPTVSLSRPAGGERLTSGSTSGADWTTSDANPGAALVELSTGGTSWQRLGEVSGDGAKTLSYPVPAVDTAAARVRVTAVDAAGNTAAATSPAFAIDAVTPRLTALTIDVRRVRVTFTEPVSGPIGTWRVEGEPALVRSVDGSSAPALTLSGARVLELDSTADFGPDETPEVSYTPSLLGELRDASTPGHTVAPSDRVVTALDGIRPPVPTLSTVDDQRPQDGRVTGDEVAPVVVVDGLVTGHTVRIDRVAGGSAVAGLPVRVASTQASPRAPRIAAEGEHVLRAVAIDPAGNQSTDADKAPGGQDGGPDSVVYLLDLPADLPPPVRDLEVLTCPPDQVQPAGFVDTERSTFRFEIDCLAAYGFTRGVTADRYAPAESVTRAQMALFVSRLARYGGVALDTRDAGFTDLGAASSGARDAINALANLGVVRGVSPGRYDPAGTVTRAQMASFLAQLQPAVGEPFPAGPNAFDDDGGDVHEANIDKIAADGIVQGVSPRTYAPLAPVTRQQMAGFLMRYVDGRVEAGDMQSAYEPS